MAIDEAGESNKDSIFSSIKDRVEDIRGRIDEAAKRSGRSGSDVLLVAVSKYAEPSDGVVEGFLRAGVFDLAENRPQRLLEKTELWDRSSFWQGTLSQTFLSAQARKDKTSNETLRWHFIGSLQRNKVRRILPYVSLIHSVDSWKLLETIERVLTEEEIAASKRLTADVETVPFPVKISVLLEAHISEDVSKQGFAPDEIIRILPKVAELKHVEARGLMGMAGLTASPAETRRQFARLRTTLEECRNCYPELTGFTELSMGMSGDFETAIEEGATIVRVGSVLYPDA